MLILILFPVVFVLVGLLDALLELVSAGWCRGPWGAIQRTVVTGRPGVGVKTGARPEPDGRVGTLSTGHTADAEGPDACGLSDGAGRGGVHDGRHHGVRRVTVAGCVLAARYCRHAHRHTLDSQPHAHPASTLAPYRTFGCRIIHTVPNPAAA
jgi:hypothetical protein